MTTDNDGLLPCPSEADLDKLLQPYKDNNGNVKPKDVYRVLYNNRAETLQSDAVGVPQTVEDRRQAQRQAQMPKVDGAIPSPTTIESDIKLAVEVLSEANKAHGGKLTHKVRLKIQQVLARLQKYRGG